MNIVFLMGMPLRSGLQQMDYFCRNSAMKVAHRKTCYPGLLYIEENVAPKDTVQFILIQKYSGYDSTDINTENFITEAKDCLKDKVASIRFDEVSSKFTTSASVYRKEYRDIINLIPEGSRIMADFTYGPKETSVLVFTVANFATRHMKCSLDRLLYGLSYFDSENKMHDPELCDMSSLYSLSHAADLLSPQQNTERSKQIINVLI